ncbi:L-ascorbate oxidase-like protein [Hordeum vulgare]|nr:L-ascorbate oxidase-like protein [Hordeum vulgare]
MQVDAEYPEPRVMLLGPWWKSFARAHNLWYGHILLFKMVGANLLSVKVYGSSGVRLICCKESSSGTESPSSHDSDEEDSVGSGSGDGFGPRKVKPEYEDMSSD